MDLAISFNEIQEIYSIMMKRLKDQSMVYLTKNLNL